jgi:glycosyltransferase involved in cell wall biosynthesis
MTVRDLDRGGRVVAVPVSGRRALANGFREWRVGARAALDSLGADIVHGQGLLPGGIAAIGAKTAPIIVTPHGNVRADTQAHYRGIGGTLRTLTRERLARLAVEGADVVVGVNPDWSINVPQRPKRFVYIPNMIDDDFFSRRYQPERGLVLFAGGPRAIKGWPLLAAAWRHVRDARPEARLNAIGWPNDVPAGIRAADRESLIIDPWLPTADVAERMARAAVLVIPSEFEVSPLVLAEAWALGLPVVATSVGGIPALASGAALIVERHAEAVAQAVVEALAGGDRVQGLVGEGRQRAEAHRPDAVADSHLRLYEELRG